MLKLLKLYMEAEQQWDSLDTLVEASRVQTKLPEVWPEPQRLLESSACMLEASGWQDHVLFTLEPQWLSQDLRID